MKKIDYKKIDKIVLGTAMASFVGLMGYMAYDAVDSSNKWREAEQTIEKITLDRLNENEQAKLDLGGEFSNYSFLCSEIKKQDNSTYYVNVNGFGSSDESKKQAFTTMKYVVDKDYFSDKNKSNYNILNKVATIIKDENITNLEVNKVNDVQKLNNVLLNINPNVNEENYTYQNLLYGINNLTVSDGIASFNAKSLYMYTDNGPTKYKTRYHYNYENEDIKLKLSEKDVELARNDESYVFDKFCDYVNQNQKENYSVQELAPNYTNYLAKDFDYTQELEK